MHHGINGNLEIVHPCLGLSILSSCLPPSLPFPSLPTLILCFPSSLIQVNLRTQENLLRRFWKKLGWATECPNLPTALRTCKQWANYTTFSGDTNLNQRACVHRKLTSLCTQCTWVERILCCMVANFTWLGLWYEVEPKVTNIGNSNSLTYINVRIGLFSSFHLKSWGSEMQISFWKGICDHEEVKAIWILAKNKRKRTTLPSIRYTCCLLLLFFVNATVWKFHNCLLARD